MRMRIGFVLALGICALSWFYLLRAKSHDAKISSAYSIIDIGTLGGGQSRAFGINNSGRVVGEAETATGITHAFLWNRSRIIDLGAFSSNFHDGRKTTAADTSSDAESSARSINSRGQIVGKGGPGGIARGGETLDTHAALWEKGQITDLGTIQYPSSAAYKINDQSVVVGNVISSSYLPSDRIGHAMGFLRDRSEMHLAGTLPNCLDINDSGDRIGCLRRNGRARVFLWKKQGRALCVLPRSEQFINILMDNKGVIAGTLSSYIGDDPTGAYFFPAQAVEWLKGKWHNLPGLPGFPDSQVKSLNNTHQIVGEVRAAYGPKSHYPLRNLAVLWQDGKVQDLNQLIPSGSGWLLEHANGINDRGQIVGSGKIEGQEHAFLLTPVAVGK